MGKAFSCRELNAYLRLPTFFIVFSLRQPSLGKKTSTRNDSRKKDLNSDEMIIFIALKKRLISLSGCQTHL